MLLNRIIPAIALLLVSACSIGVLREPQLASTYLHSGGRLAACADLFRQADHLTLKAGSKDAQAARLAGFPYLRVNRFLASFRDELQDTKKIMAWMQALRQLDRQARYYELQNAPAPGAGADTDADLLEQLDACADTMMQADLQRPAQLEKIKQAATVADSYSVANRLLGIYALSSLFVKSGVRRFQRKIKATFATTTAIQGKFRHYTAPGSGTADATEVTRILQSSNKNALSIPAFNKQDEAKLFDYFAPVWEVDEVDSADRFGAPYWPAKGKLMIQNSDPVVYRLLSFTRFQGQILPQLNYIIWFSARPSTSMFDILAGHLDGITWRVTIDRNGKPLMYDTMHNCGCYHMFFPADGVRQREQRLDDSEEPILVPVQAPELQHGLRLHLRIASGSHYIEAMQAKPAAAGSVLYRYADYNDLRSLAVGHDGHRSMFGVNGIVPDTSRKERWVLWPMGVADPGAMRQWGNHATAFVGRRHFDDAYLLERYFRLP